MLDVDEGHHAAGPLGLGQDVLAERRLAGRLGAEDLGDPAARNPADAEGQVQGDRAGRDDVDLLPLGRPELHDRAAPELLLDGQDGGVDRLAPLGRRALAVAGLEPSFAGDRHGPSRSYW